MKTGFSLAILSMAALALPTATQHVRINEGTAVKLTFDQAISSKTAHPGDRVHMHVTDTLMVDNHPTIPAGTKVNGVITDVKQRGRFGKNARLRLTLDPFKWHGMTIQLQPRDKGKEFKGSKTDKAALASGGGAVLLGPVGLVGGVFVTGKNVEVKPGDTMMTQVAKSVVK